MTFFTFHPGLSLKLESPKYSAKLNMQKDEVYYNVFLVDCVLR